MAKKVTYSSALKELEDILEKIENDELDVDSLMEKVKRATELLKICKTKLHSTQSEIEDVLNSINND